MNTYAAVPLFVILAACSAEPDNGQAAEANVVDTLLVNNLVITDTNTATVREMETHAPPPAQPAQTAAPVADKGDGRTTAAEPKQGTKSSTEAPAKPAPKPRAEQAADSQPEAQSSGECTPEHREMGHC